MIDFLVATAETAARPFRETAAEPLVLLGTSPVSTQLREAVSKAAIAAGPVLVVGEPGSGRSAVARALHHQGPRSAEHCAVVHCSALSASAIEEELFGGRHEGVSRPPDWRGALEAGDGGTVILEQAESIPRRTQARLARFLDSGKVEGGRHAARINTRLIATCAQPPSAKRDCDHTLWARLARNTVRVPSLRERQTDIPSLARFFALNAGNRAGHVAFAADAMHALAAYSWPGNLTQLKGVVERLASSGRDSIQAHDLPVGIRPRRTVRKRDDKFQANVGAQLFDRLQRTGESFWTCVYPLFMRREITRRDLRDLLQRALDAARDDRHEVLGRLNLAATERRRFEKFLRRYDCSLT